MKNRGEKWERANRARSQQKVRARQPNCGPRARGPALNQGLNMHISDKNNMKNKKQYRKQSKWDKPVFKNPPEEIKIKNISQKQALI